jgi:hypothetical protein
MLPLFTRRCTALNVAANCATFFTVGASEPMWLSDWANALPPSLRLSPEKSTYISVLLLFLSTGDTVLRMSLTSPAAEIITVPGANTLSSPYFWVMDRESLPVGMLMPSAHANSLHASTARYSAASSPWFLQGHIQFALRDIDSRPFLRGAPTIFVRASAIAITEPFAESASAICGA